MKRTLLSLALVAVFAVPATAQVPTPEAQAILDKVDAVAAELQQLAVDVHKQLDPPPVPPPVPVLTDATSLKTAIATGCGTFRLAPGRYVGNFARSGQACAFTLAGADGLTGRINPAAVADWTLVANDRSLPVLVIQSNDVTVSGLTLTGALPTHTTVQVGSNVATTSAAQPAHVTFDQVAILADPLGGHRGLEFQVIDGVLTHSWIAGFVEEKRDSQAVWINNAPGPIRIEDNFLEASGENLLVGGDTVRIPGLVPADLTIRYNTFYKNPLWRKILNADGTVAQAGRPGSVKNTFELKCARRVTFEHNVLDGMWVDAQPGNVIVLTPRNQNGDSPWCVVEDVTVRWNSMVNVIGGAAVNLLGISDNPDPRYATGRTARITIDHNLFPTPAGILINRGVLDLVVTNNTFPGVKASIFKFTGTDPVKTTLTVSNNVFRPGAYGISGDGTTIGKVTLDAYAPGAAWSGNVIEKGSVWIAWPAGTTLLAPGALAPLLDATGHYVAGGAGW